MITTPEEYVKYLWGIETQEPLYGSQVTADEPDQAILDYLELLGINPAELQLDEEGRVLNPATGEVVMHTVNPYNNKPILSVILPSDEKTFDVDLDSREISVPTFLSVSKDHRAETIYFLVDRYYDYKDLSQTSCIIEFINAVGEGGYYVVPFYDISSYPRYFDEDNVKHEAKMLIPWCIEGNATKGSGPVQFAIRFYQLDDANKNFIYNLRTKIATAQVLEGMDESILDAHLDTDLMANLLAQINYKLDIAESTIYWTDLPKY